MPLVSVIVPIYNAEKYLSECLECLINQTYKNLEIICINDGSKDKTLNILKEYAQKDNRIKVFSQENMGEAETRNRGVNLATGKYIFALDADDICSTNTIESSIDIALKQNIDIVINFMNVRLNLDKKNEKDFSYTTVWQLLYKKELLDKNPDIIYNKNLKMGPDVIFTHKVLGLTNRIAKNLNSKYYYRRHDSQISNIITHQPDKFIENIKVWFEDLIDFYDRHAWWESHNDHFVNFLCEQPFTAYLRLDINSEQKKFLFDKIHDVVHDKNLNINFDYSNIRVQMFKIFMTCENYKQFELYWFIGNLYLKYIDLIKRLKSLLRIK